VRRALFPFFVTALLVVPSQASAASNLGYQTNGTGVDDDAFTISGSDIEGLQAKFSVGCFFGCSFTVSSIQGLNDFAAQCSQTAPPSTTDYTCDGDAVSGGTQPPGRGIITGTAGPDTVEGSCFFENVALTFTGGAGDDRLTNACTEGNIDLGPGDDTALQATRFFEARTNTIAGGDGDDRIVGIEDADTFQGGPGRDFLRGGDGSDLLDGGEGNDIVEGEEGADSLVGGPGRDTLDGGLGTDSISGGDGSDTVTYEERAGAQPITITLDGAANDGEAGENDAINADIEDAIGGAGDDTITGNPGANEIDGGDGGDVIDGLGGRDTIDGGPGNDRITSRDGIQESIDCGDGNDLAVTDEFDSAANCETVQASRELMADIDNDGIPAPTDCDDRNPNRRPGLPDKPGNKVDENCDGADTPFGHVITPVQSLFSTSGGRTRVLRLRVVDVPTGARIELRCKGGKKLGCFQGVKRFPVPRGAAAKNVRGPVKQRKLKASARLEVRVLAPDAIGKVVRYTMRKGNALPKSKLLCVTPGTKRPKKC
jgi:Ca2+-binding RTX toxin-like protein